jgi:hypothetical protein
MSAPDRRALIDRDDSRLSIRRQCALLGVARSGVYQPPRPANDTDLGLMRRIDELFTAWPFLGSRRMAALLRAEGYGINRKRVQRLMRKMGIAALGPKPRTTKSAPGHKIFPYLLRGMMIERPNQVWAADITYVPIGRGFLYLMAVMDWASRAVLAWRLSNTMEYLRRAEARQRLLQRRDAERHARAVDGQRVHRAAVALAQARGCLPQGLCRRPRSQGRDRGVDRLLQSPAPAPGARQPHADGGLARGRQRRTRRGCGYDASRAEKLGQRWRVAHIPTAATTSGFDRIMDSGERNGRDSN